MKNSITRSKLSVANFQKLVDGKNTELCILSNKQGAELVVLNYGAKIVSLMVPDRDGRLTDVVTGHNSIEEYLTSEEPYFGAICGRYGNRIAKGRFTLDGVTYDQLPINNGPNCLHGGIKGFNSKVWDAEQPDEQTLLLHYTSPDGEEGFPGTLHVTVTYRLTDNNEVELTYQATTDKDTVLNLTNHAFFNLSGAGTPTVHDHVLTIHASKYLPADDTAIPYGDPVPVAGTPMDFSTPHTIGERIDEPFEQLIFGRGYDHCYVLDKGNGSYAEGARCSSPRTGIVMTVYTTEPGIQLYTANWLAGKSEGKKGLFYPSQSAFCLETQHFPDSPNHPQYPTTLLR